MSLQVIIPVVSALLAILVIFKNPVLKRWRSVVILILGGFFIVGVVILVWQFLITDQIGLADFLIFIATSIAPLGAILYTIYRDFTTYNRGLTQHRLNQELLRESQSQFPYRKVSLDELFSEYAGFDIPYCSRSSDSTQEKIDQKLLRNGHILFMGERGMGKTREALEFIRKLITLKRQEFQILIPEEKDLIFPLQDFLKGTPPGNIILFIENLQSLIAKSEIRKIRSEEEVESQKTFEQRLSSVIDGFERHCRGFEFRIIATAIPENTDYFNKALQNNRPLGRDFYKHYLQGISKRQRVAFIKILETHFDIKIDQEVLDYLQLNSDGTYEGIIQVFKSFERGKALKFGDVQKIKVIAQQDWDQQVYQKYIQKNVAQRLVFEALGVLNQAHLQNYNELVINLAIELWKNPFSLFKRPRILKAIKELGIYDINSKNGILYCKPVYLEGKGNFEANIDLLINVLKRISRSHPILFLFLLPSIFSFITIIKNNRENLNEIADIIKYVISVIPNEISLQNTLAYVFRLLEDYEGALSVARKAIEIEPVNYIANMEQVKAYHELGKINDEINLLNKLTQSNPESPEVWHFLSIAYSRTGSYEQANLCCRRATELAPHNSIIWCSYGIILDRLGNHQEAIDAFTNAIEFDPVDPTPILSLAIVYDHLNEYEKCIQLSEQVAILAPYSPAPLVVMARSYLALGNYEKAIDKAEQAEKLAPEDLRRQYLLLVIFQAAGMRDKAENALNRIKDLIDLRKAESWILLGHGCQEMGFQDEALDAFQKAVNIDTNNKVAWKRISYLHNKLGNPSQALGAARRVSELEPDNPENWNKLGISYSKLEQYPEALEALERALGLDPDFVPAWKTKSGIYYSMNEHQLALEAARRVSELAPDNPESWNVLGLSYSKLEQYPEALEALERALGLDPDFVPAWKTKSGIYNSMNEHQLALEAARRVSELAPDNPESWNVLGLSYSKLEQYPEALEALERALQLDPMYVDAWRTKGAIYNRLLLYEEALEAAIRLSELEPENSENWIVLGITYSKLGLQDDAMRAWEHAFGLESGKQNSSNLTMLLFRQGMTFCEMGKVEEGIPMVEKAVENEPLNSSFLAGLSKAYRIANRFDEAIKIADKLIQDEAYNPSYWYLLGNAYLEANLLKDAKDAYEKTLQLKPNHASAINKHKQVNQLMSDDSLIMTTAFRNTPLTRADILTALRDFDAQYPDTNDYDNWLDKANYTYALLYDRKRYPPKYILSVVTGIPLNELHGGEPANRVFRELDFDIENK